jgi:hypothetical protein
LFAGWQVVRTFSSSGKNAEAGGGGGGGADFVNACISPSGRYLYAIAADAVMYVFSVDSGQLEHVLKVPCQLLYHLAFTFTSLHFTSPHLFACLFVSM